MTYRSLDVWLPQWLLMTLFRYCEAQSCCCMTPLHIDYRTHINSVNQLINQWRIRRRVLLEYILTGHQDLTHIRIYQRYNRFRTNRPNVDYIPCNNTNTIN
jgi:hypothetical protein